MFFSFDGVDGAGKSTQIGLFCDWLRRDGREVVACREPGGTALGEKLRGILLDHHHMAIHRRSEMLLYMASRAQLVEEVIRPALAAGKFVVCDRFLLASVAYQGHAGGLAAEDIWQVGSITVAGLMPRLTFVLDMPAAAAAGRIRREKDRMESQGTEYLERVRQGFLMEAKQRPEQITVIDGGQPVEQVHAAVVAAAERVLA